MQPSVPGMSEKSTSAGGAAASEPYRIRPLAPDTWDAFVTLCDQNNGAGMGGCWCTWFHNATMRERRACTGGDDDQAREYKHSLVEAGRAHAALVFDGDAAVGWCEYGSPEELPGIAHRKDVEQPGEPVPDFRITCFFVDRRHRRRGVATAALDVARSWRPDVRADPTQGVGRSSGSSGTGVVCAGAAMVPWVSGPLSSRVAA